MWTCLLCPTLLHPVSQRKGDSVDHIQKLQKWTNFTFPWWGKKIHSSAWGSPLCMTKTKNEIKTPYSIRKQGKSWENKCSPRKTDVRKRLVGFIFFKNFLNKIKLSATKCNSAVKHPYLVYIQEGTSFVSRMQFDLELCIRNKWVNTS